MDKWTENEIQPPKNKNEGKCFKFEVDGIEILACGSRITGLETVYVDRVLKSKKRTFGKASTHRFRIDGNELEVSFKVPNVFGNKAICTLSRNNEPIESYTCTYKTNSLVFISSIAILVLVFFFLGFAKVKLGLPDSIDFYVYIAQAVCVIGLTVYVLSKSKAVITKENN